MTTEKNWWAPVWRGLVVDSSGKHFQRLDGAVWMLLYLILHARRQNGVVWAKTATVSRATGIARRTIQRWLRVLLRHGYIIPVSGRHRFVIVKWRPIGRTAQVAPNRAGHGARRATVGANR